MTLLEALVIAHFIGDFLLQTKDQAMNKALGGFFNRALWLHCTVYTACSAAVLCTYRVPCWWAVWILGWHLFFDRRWPVLWWRRVINKNPPEDIERTFWLTIVVDQVFHVLTLVVVAVGCS